MIGLCLSRVERKLSLNDIFLLNHGSEFKKNPMNVHYYTTSSPEVLIQIQIYLKELFLVIPSTKSAQMILLSKVALRAYDKKLL